MRSLSSLLVWAWLMASSFIVSGNMDAFASPIATSAFRFALALWLIFMLLVWQWKRSGLNVKQALVSLLSSKVRCLHYIFISGTLVGFFIGLFVALKYTTPLNTSVLYTLVPLMGVFIARVWLGEVLIFLKICGFVLGSLGACVILFSHQGLSDFSAISRVSLLKGINFEINRGDLIFLLACFLLALHVVSVQKWGRTLAPLSGAFMIMLFGLVWLIPITLIWGELGLVKWQQSGFWLNSLYLTLFATLFTFILQQSLVASVGASKLLAFSYSIPLWVACYTAFAQQTLSSLLSSGFILGLVLLGLAYCLIESHSLVMFKRQRINRWRSSKP